MPSALPCPFLRDGKQPEKTAILTIHGSPTEEGMREEKEERFPAAMQDSVYRIVDVGPFCHKANEKEVTTLSEVYHRFAFSAIRL
jgi:hypothetical protein